MLSDEEFSLVSKAGVESRLSPLELIRQEIQIYKATYDRLLEDQAELSKATVEQRYFGDEFRQRAVKHRMILEEDEQNHALMLEDSKKRLASLQKSESLMRLEVLQAEEEMLLLDEQNQHLKQQLTTTLPEKDVVFTGDTREGAETCSYDMKPQIVYPMEGGTALVTFEDEAVAQKILSLGEHKVSLGECFIRVEAKPVQILMPSHVEMDTYECPRRILISNLPPTKKMEQSRVLDKLEIHFSKSFNGGGEVANAEMMHDSGNAVITFTTDNVAKGLTDVQYHEVNFGTGRKHKVLVSPFLHGELKNLQTRVSESRRTVLLTGIPTILEQGDLQDHLEIHFQKGLNNGGEVDAFFYNPPGQCTLAIFEEDCPSP